MRARQIGLTKLYNLFHDPTCDASDIQNLRKLHVEMDNAVVAAYGWKLDLDHDLYETKQGLRFTISPQARATILDLLLALNHERYAAERQQSQGATKRARAPRARRTPANARLFEMNE
jgi:hypothetical protein